MSRRAEDARPPRGWMRDRCGAEDAATVGAKEEAMLHTQRRRVRARWLSGVRQAVDSSSLVLTAKGREERGRGEADTRHDATEDERCPLGGIRSDTTPSRVTAVRVQSSHLARDWQLRCLPFHSIPSHDENVKNLYGIRKFR